MVEYKRGNLLESNEEAIVNTVNCVGVMGRGIALQFKKQYPDNYSYYETACKRNEVVPGKMLVYETNALINPRYIINFPTKRHWRGTSRIEDIESGLTDLSNVITSRKIKSIAIPPLGCGLGGLDWNKVKPRIESVFNKLDGVHVNIYEPAGTPPDEKTTRSKDVPKMTNGRAALICLIRQYLNGFLDPIITLSEINKILFFLQECGEPLQLNYVQSDNGLYATNLSYVLNAIEGHFLSGYTDSVNNLNNQIYIIPGADSDADEFLKNKPETLNRIARVNELIDGFESPSGIDLLATIYWSTINGSAAIGRLTDAINTRSFHKSLFSNKQNEAALNRLINLNWLPAHTEVSLKTLQTTYQQM